MKIPGLRYGNEKVDGLVFFGRMLDKARLHAAGKLPDGYFRGNGPDGTCLDGRVCRFLHVPYEAVVERTLQGGTDEEILAWCHEHGRKPNAEELLIFNAFMLKRGWRDESSANLMTWKTEAGFGHRDSIQTWIELQIADESDDPKVPVTITYLEMRSASEMQPSQKQPEGFEVREARHRLGALNQFFYLNVGGDWKWTDKSRWTANQWDNYVDRDSLRTFVGYYMDTPCGYTELLREESGDIQIAYFGLLPAFIGKGLGSALLSRSLAEAWNWGSPGRVWVHTCSLDHPAAVANYQARGMKTYKTETIER